VKIPDILKNTSSQQSTKNDSVFSKMAIDDLLEFIEKGKKLPKPVKQQP